MCTNVQSFFIARHDVVISFVLLLLLLKVTITILRLKTAGKNG